MNNKFEYLLLGKEKDKLIKQNADLIKELYKEVSNNLKNDFIKYASEVIENDNRVAYKQALLTRQMKADIDKELKQLQYNLKEVTKKSVNDAEKLVKKYNESFLKEIGFGSYLGKGLTTNIVSPNLDAVQRVLTGSVYQKGWSLSDTIWKDVKDTQDKLNRIIAGGLAQGESIKDISKKIVDYVNPSARKQWNLKDKDGRYIYPKKVDYNAQRLVRTLTQHSYQLSLIESTQNNPFISKFEWVANGSRVCPICLARNGKKYDKDKVPLDHPNGMCVLNPVVDKDMNKKIADWVNSPKGTYPDIDKFARDFGYRGPNAKKKADAQVKVKAKSAEKAKTPLYTDWVKLCEKNKLNQMLKKEDEWLKKLTKTETDALKLYTGSSYNEMNAYLRFLASGLDEEEAFFESGIIESELKAIKNAIKGLNKIKLDEDFVVRRGTNVGDLAGLFMKGDFSQNKEFLSEKTAEQLNDMFQGAVGEYAGFTSTSSLYNKGFRGEVEVMLFLPKGTKASSIMNISKYGTDEGELLLNAGTKVKCKKIEKSDRHMSSTIRVFLEVIA